MCSSTNYRPSKHGPLLDGFDYVFDDRITMVDNTCNATHALFGCHTTAHNGMTPPQSLCHRKFTRRVLIHPTSADSRKNWPKPKFLKLAHFLQELDFQPRFILSLQERDGWPQELTPGIQTLEDLASIIYESDYFIGNDSGPAHLASLLSIPHLIIRRYEKNATLWQTGWHRGVYLYPPRWLVNIKGFRLREEKWKHFITTKGVLNCFKTIIK